jgi:hypothetical protein
MVTFDSSRESEKIFRLPGVGEHPSEFLLSNLEVEILKIIEQEEPAIVKVFKLTRLISVEAARVSDVTALEVSRGTHSEDTDK